MSSCKAISKRTKEQCKNYAMRGRTTCRFHGGVLGSKKARKARRNAVLKHGFFTISAMEERLYINNLIKSCKNVISK